MKLHPAILIIDFITLITFLLCAVFIWNTAKRPDRNVIFGVTLPPEVRDRPEVKKAEARFGKLCLGWGTVLVLTFLPVPVLLETVPNRISLSVVSLLVWAMGVSVYCINRPFRAVRRELLGIKRQNGWCFGAMHEAAVDTKASLLKNRSALPAWLFLPAAALPGVLLFTARGPLQTATMLAAFSGMGLTAVFFCCHRAAKHLKTRVWSENSEVNVAVNCERQRIWSQFWIITAYWNGIACVAGWTLFALPGSGPYWIAAVSIFAGFAEFALVVLSNSSFRRFRERLLAADGAPVLTDDDDYWKDSWFAGEIYCNPNDESAMVEKRTGSGTTPNVATKKGRAFSLGTLAFCGALAAVISAFLLLSDFSTPALRIDGASRTVSINTAFYGTTFGEASIRSVALVGSIPNRFRTNGSDDGYSAVGQFTVDGYGPSLLYIHEKEAPYILIRLPDKYVFYNEKTKERTEAVYRELKAAAG